jgi:hypothetical protein
MFEELITVSLDAENFDVVFARLDEAIRIDKELVSESLILSVLAASYTHAPICAHVLKEFRYKLRRMNIKSTEISRGLLQCSITSQDIFSVFEIIHDLGGSLNAVGLEDMIEPLSSLSKDNEYQKWLAR